MQYHTGKLDRIQGFSDPVYAIRIYEFMKAAGCDIELFLYDDTPHSFLNAMTDEGVEFLQKWDYGVPPKEQVWLCLDRIIQFFNKHLR